MSRFEFHNTPLAGLIIAERKPIIDDRGYFERFFCINEFREIGIKKPIAQINHTLTHKKGTVRGLHFQHKPHSETKIVSCVVGTVFDVAVDLRANSSTFLHWHGEILSSENCRSLLIPEGFAHGFQTLTDNCELVYFHTELYHKESEGALNASDSKLGILWPIPITELSVKDRALPFIDREFKGLDL